MDEGVAMEALVTLGAPLLSACVLGGFSHGWSRRAAGWFAMFCMVVASVSAAMLGYEHLVRGITNATIDLGSWIQVGGLDIHYRLLLDPLSVTMVVMVVWIATLVHGYSLGYMHDDPSLPRFLGYLSLFTVGMLVLVTADNLVQLFIGWEGVGACSYLLIGFWFHKPSANRAAIKAFVVNRVGDIGLVLGMVMLYSLAGTLEFSALWVRLPEIAQTHYWLAEGWSFHGMTIITACLLIGCMGKSAQWGLHVWLPDAMEGPTPVSALIHAATMVTAGIFLMVRCSPLLELAPSVMQAMVVLGMVTALAAALIGLVQDDIKRVIAYSTCSQLGYMLMACGLGGYAAAMFHLLTHAFFKALLFLSAGSVIHGVGGEQSMAKMGGIASRMKWTYTAFWLGSLALAGIFPFAGYYSKDTILELAYAYGGDLGLIAYGVGTLAAGLTAFYSWRLLFLVFHGSTRLPAEVDHHVHESPWSMRLPLVLLMVGSCGMGLLGMHYFGWVDASRGAWGSSVVFGEAMARLHDVPGWVPWLPMAVSVSGIVVAWIFYRCWPCLPSKLAAGLAWVYAALWNQLGMDALYGWLFVRPYGWLSHWVAMVGEPLGVDRLVSRLPSLVVWQLGRGLSLAHSGLVYHSVLVMLASLAVWLTCWLAWRV
jgi:NADH-quinone oxidoreductase subunit L